MFLCDFISLINDEYSQFVRIYDNELEDDIYYGSAYEVPSQWDFYMVTSIDPVANNVITINVDKDE